MDILIFERRHANGAVARVHRDTEGAGYLPSASPDFDEPDEDAWPYVDTIDEAQAAADAAAHPDCTGEGCGPWVTQYSGPIE
jgi:hypothetical protein